MKRSHSVGRTLGHLVASPALLLSLLGSPAFAAARVHFLNLERAPEPSAWLLVIGVLLLASRRSRRARS